jgi:hypothetical protein
MRGQKALVLCVTITITDKDAIEIDDTKMVVVYRSRWFVLSQTDGESYEPLDVPTWNEERALQALGVKIVPFAHPDGNMQGYATPEGSIAINSIAALPHKTLFHELAHIILGHAKDKTAISRFSTRLLCRILMTRWLRAAQQRTIRLPVCTAGKEYCCCRSSLLIFSSFFLSY